MTDLSDINAPADYAQLALEDRAHGSIYTSPDIFQAEMDRIFHRTWLCVGHEAELRAPGDFRATLLGRQPVIMVRGADNKVRVLMNRCMHRGTALVPDGRGRENHFTCPYHGWSYNTLGELIALPDPQAYDHSFSKADYGLTPAPAVAAYRGFVFASLSADVPSLEEHLGLAKRYIDLFIDVSPLGEIEVHSGAHKTSYAGNWKFVGMDGYHPNTVHKSMMDMWSRRPGHVLSKTHPGGSPFSDAGENVTRDLGNGHVLLDLYPGRRSNYPNYREKMLAKPSGKEYYAAMVRAHGQARADEILTWAGDPHAGIFANLQLIEVQIRIIRPVSVDRTEVLMFPTLLKGAPEEVNQERLSRHEAFYGPAGHGSPDDAEMFERNQAGLAAEVNPWVFLGRGLHRERRDGDGSLVGRITDETTQRGQLKQWKLLMSGRGARTQSPGR